MQEGNFSLLLYISPFSLFIFNGEEVRATWYTIFDGFGVVGILSELKIWRSASALNRPKQAQADLNRPKQTCLKHHCLGSFLKKGYMSSLLFFIFLVFLFSLSSLGSLGNKLVCAKGWQFFPIYMQKDFFVFFIFLLGWIFSAKSLRVPKSLCVQKAYKLFFCTLLKFLRSSL